MAELKIENRLGSFVTIPNAFKQCTIMLLIIHFAIFMALKEPPPTAQLNVVFKGLITTAAGG